MDVWVHALYTRWGLSMKVKWRRESDKVDQSWGGLPYCGYIVCPTSAYTNDLMRAGPHSDTPSWPARVWIKGTTELDMRQTVSTARNLRAYHEHPRS